jgi:succinylglutamate desuccinylase
MKRVLGVVEGKDKGPLNILLGGLHGNEVAGIKAINEVFHAIRLHRIPIKGTLVGLAGNLQAIAQNRRFIDYDLNRCWTEEFVERVYEKDHTLAEDIELKTLHQTIIEFKHHDHPVKVLIDLHTTSSEKGNFIVVPKEEATNPMVRRLQQPVVIDLDQHLSGTLLRYLQGHGFLAMVFEGGLIGSSEAIDLHVAGIWEILQASGAIDQEVDSSFIQSGKKLEEFSRNLPGFVKVRYHHKIKKIDGFIMNPGFRNFQPVKQGQVVARDVRGDIKAPVSGLMFMPLYQTSGDDGFFIVEEVSVMELS